MKNIKRISFLIIVLFFAIGLTGCNLAFTPSSKNTGGVFKSYDFGENWQPVNLIKNEKNRKKNISFLNIQVIKLDPQNHKNIYLGSRENGLWYSGNAAESWQNIFKRGSVLDIALDAKNSGVIYISLGRRIYKSIDLGQKWKLIYLEERERVQINSLAIDPNNNLLLYMGTSHGEVYKTKDGGKSWQAILESEKNSSIQKILINPKNTNIVYVGTKDKGIYRSSNQGQSWINLKNNYYDIHDKKQVRKYQDVEIFRDLVFDLTQHDALIYASNYGLLKSTDGGKSWRDIKLLTPPRSVIIRSVAADPQDNKKIYYVTKTGLYRTFDAGQTWLTSSLSSSRPANKLAIDYQTPNIVYMGMNAF